MSLQNLVRTGQLVEHETDKVQSDRLLLDTFRVKRNAADYTGELVDEGSVIECIEAAVRLQEILIDWLTSNRPDLID